MTWDDAEHSDDSAEQAAALLGARYLYPYQRFVIANIEDVFRETHDETMEPKEFTAESDRSRLRQIVVLPTGSGKSLCFQAPALYLPGPTIVVYPLLALMADQERRLAASGTPCAVFRGEMTLDEFSAASRGLRSGALRIALTNPESMAGPRLRALLHDIGVAHVAIDEAHCVSQWGNSFRPAYRSLGTILSQLNPPAITAFTATASSPVLADIAQSLFGDDPYVLVAGDADRPNLHYSVEPTLSKDHTVTRVLRSGPRPAIVFCRSRPGTQILAERLTQRKVAREIKFYHAGLSREEKGKVESWFMNSHDGVLVATCAYGMGMDKPDIRLVVHRDSPPSVEAYVQESGRAGRDGKRSLAVLVQTPTDSGMLLHAYAGVSGCRRHRLLALLDAPETYCSGCDTCDGTARINPEGQREILDFVRRNARRYTLAETARSLVGEHATERCAHRGILADWSAEDAAGAVRALIDSGTVRKMGFPWKRRLTVSKYGNLLTRQLSIKRGSFKSRLAFERASYDV